MVAPQLAGTIGLILGPVPLVILDCLPPGGSADRFDWRKTMRSGRQNRWGYWPTGSIGRQALDVIEQHGDRFRLLGIVAYNETTFAGRAGRQISAPGSNVTDHTAYKALKARLPGEMAHPGNTGHVSCLLFPVPISYRPQ